MVRETAARRTSSKSAALLGVSILALALVAGTRGSSLDVMSRLNGIYAGGSTAPASDVTATLKYTDLVAFESVKYFLRSQGVDKDDWSTYDDLEGYLPREITVTLAEDKVEGDLGVDAVEGHVFTAITYTGSDAFTASYLLVMSMRGDLEQSSPVYGTYMIEQGYAESKASRGTIFQPLGLKMFNTTHVLISMGSSGTSGPRALWHWEADTWTTLCDGAENDAHDIQWAYETAAVWQVDGTTKVEEASASTGDVIAHFAEKKVQDPNHLQAVSEDSVFYISSRQTDSIIKMNADGKVEWTLGGEYGDYEIEDYDGTKYAAGDVVWSGQHNAEYFGDDEFCMFDNQEESNNIYDESRMLCVKLVDHGDTKKGVVTFNYFMGAYTAHFGDNDRLPTGNQLGIHWPYYIDEDSNFDVRAVEVVRSSGDLAWEMTISGAKCDELKKGCDHTAGGWYAYSIERVYKAPIIYNVACSDAQVTFDVVNTFKQKTVPLLFPHAVEKSK